MILSTTTNTEVTAKDLAETLSNASADEFAEVIFQLAQILHHGKEENRNRFVKAVGKAMYPRSGALRKILFKDIYNEIIYNEVLNQKDKK